MGAMSAGVRPVAALDLTVPSMLRVVSLISAAISIQGYAVSNLVAGKQRGEVRSSNKHIGIMEVEACAILENSMSAM